MQYACSSSVMSARLKGCSVPCDAIVSNRRCLWYFTAQMYCAQTDDGNCFLAIIRLRSILINFLSLVSAYFLLHVADPPIPKHVFPHFLSVLQQMSPDLLLYRMGSWVLYPSLLSYRSIRLYEDYELVMQHLKCRIYVGCREAVQTVLLGAIKALQLERFKDGWYLHTFLRE